MYNRNYKGYNKQTTGYKDTLFEDYECGRITLDELDAALSNAERNTPVYNGLLARAQAFMKARDYEGNWDWEDCEKAEAECDAYEKDLEAAYQAGYITGAQFDDLILIAFYDWDGEWKVKLEDD